MKHHQIRLAAWILCFVLCLMVVMPAAAVGEEGRTETVVMLNDTPMACVLKRRVQTEYAPGIYVTDDKSAQALERLGVVELSGANSTLWLQAAYTTEQWNMKAVKAEAAWAHTGPDGAFDSRGDRVVVALIDSGVAVHRDLDMTRFLEVPEQYSGAIEWHGTAVAGILAAQLDGKQLDGTAPEVSIMSLRVTNEYGRTDVATVVSAIDYAVENGADVINISIGGTEENELLSLACRKAAERGVILVSSAGNYLGGETRSALNKMYPASCGYVVSVSACRQTENGYAFDEDYSYYNDMVTACAPGTQIPTLCPGHETSVQTGTSFAAPMVAGMAAIAKQWDKSIDLAGFTALLSQTCADLGDAGRDDRYGWGLVDMAAFVARLEELYPAPGDAEPELPGDVNPVLPGSIGGDEQSGGAASAPASYTLRFEANGGAPVEDITAAAGTVIDLEAHSTTREGYRFIGWYADGALTEKSYSVTLDGDAIVYAGWDIDIAELGNPFDDVAPEDYYYDAVRWAFAKDITGGTDTGIFSPGESCTRAQVVTFLWRAAGAPEVRGESPFTDVPEEAYYHDAVLWAVEQGITEGTSASTFSPEEAVTRAQLVTFLYRYAGSIAVADEPDFGDVAAEAYYADAVRWAAAMGITQGTSDVTFGPEDSCTRGQTVTFLYRHLFK